MESFIDVLERIGAAQEPTLRYDPEDDAGWREAFREAVDGLRGPVPERVPLAVETREIVEEADHTRHVLRIRVNAFWELPAYLLVPKDLAPGEKRPGVVVLHGHDAYGMDSMAGLRAMDEGDEERRRAYALKMVEAGYVALAPAWWGWPGRDGHVDRVGRRDKCNVIQMAAGMYGMNVLDMHIQDGQAAVDALVDRPEVDGERIGCIGNSYGGRTTMWLTVFEPRIKVCVAAGCMNTFRERSLKLSSCAVQYLPGILNFGDVHELFSLIAPRPMQFQAGEGDALITDTDREEILETVRKAYTATGAADAIDYVLHPDGHLLRCDLATPFLEKHL